MFLEHARPFYQSATMMSLSPISLDKYEDFVIKHFSANQLTVATDAISHAYHLLQGNTYYMQKTFREAFAMALGGKTCDKQMIEDIISSIMQDNSHKYSESLAQLTLPQKELLMAIATEGRARRITSSQFVKRHRLKSASSVQAAIRKLMEYGIVTVQENEYYIEDQLLQRWLMSS